MTDSDETTQDAAPTPEQRARVLLVHNKLTSFVRNDRDLLRAHYRVEEFAVAGHWASPLAVWRAVRRSDVVYCWFASAHALLPALAGRALRRPVVVAVGGYDTANMPEIGYGHQRGGIKKYVARGVMMLATRLAAHSQYAANEAIREAGIPAHKVRAIYPGVTPVGDGIVAAPGNGNQHREDLIVTVGNIDRPNLWRKGLEPFVRAAAELPQLQFVVVGDWLDDAIDYLREIAPPNVAFTGRVSDTERDRYLRDAAVYVQASAHEAFGVAVAEAMTAGCVPAVTRAGSLPEVVGDSGEYAESTEPAGLAAAISRALAADAARRAEARERVLRCFSLDRRATELSMLIDDLLASGENARASTAGSASTEARSTRLWMADAPAPLVSVVIPVRNEEASIADCVQAVVTQDYPADRLEVLVVDGQSTDRTRAIVGRIASADPLARVRLLDNPRGIAPTAMNIGIRAARGDVIARVDGHTIIAPDYLRRCVEALRASGADNVGGLMRPRGRGYIGTCIALATGSRFGIGNSRFHYDEQGGDAETVYLGCFRRSVFERVGLFDEELVRNQDDELNDRIIAAGGRVWLDPRIRSTYFNRGSLRSLWRQYYQYGYWKVRVLGRHPGARRLRHLAPSALVSGLAGAAVLSALATPARFLPRPARRALRALAILPWVIYALASSAAAVPIAARSGWRYGPGLLAAFWCLHLSYGAGFMAGLAAARRPRTKHINRRRHP